ncbi:type II toxin-antitoxin system VapC family toxin [Pedobacter terrae]|uniref:type II toxin-antitoxin system VapC family toxin n=1 Tax=Pedobacter terrae TaxID=405671 RepID=UPI003FA7D95B
MTNDDKLSKKIKNLIEEPTSNCFVSIACYRELSSKYAPGRLNLHSTIEEIFNVIEKSGFDILPITINHLIQLSKLEHFPNDPFDRRMISQSIIEKLNMVSNDIFFPAYKVSLIKH